MYICPQCGDEVVGKIEDHYRFYPECAKKASQQKTEKRFTLSELYQKTRLIIEGLKTGHELQGPLTASEYIHWISQKLNEVR